MKKFLNFASFQITWFACILGAASGWELLGIAIGTIAVIYNLMQAAHFESEFKLLLKGVLLGIAIDTSLIHFSLITFETHYWKLISPVWMWIIWASLMTTLDSSMAWLKNRIFLGAILGAIAGAASYFAGIRLGAGYFINTINSLIVIAVAWFFVTPLIVYWASRENDKK